ncbi:MAG: cyclic nucleotide-binding domain-containing protein [Deltaproteobacteria bacterium]|nr:cyclic nucleotide-binding domain-containing protein [Deltaproteobacteria bacterium]
MNTPSTHPPFESSVNAETLGRIGLFGGLNEEMLTFIAGCLRVSTLSPGDAVFHEGENAAEMFVVLSGEFEVLKRSKRGIDARVAMLGMGDWFGEMSILDVQPRSATVRALAPSRLLLITSGDLDAIYRKDQKSYALLVLNVARELSRRLRVADGILADLVVSLIDDLVSSRHGTAT